jgi:hypothetical protein
MENATGTWRKKCRLFSFLPVIVYGLVSCAGSEVARDLPEMNPNNLSIHRNPETTTRTWRGGHNIEPGLRGKSILFFEDFEDPLYEQKWPVHWGSALGQGTVSDPPSYVFSGRRSAYTESKKGRHESSGSGEYVPEAAVDGEAYVRLYLRLQDGFSMGSSRELKLFGIRGGARLEDTYGGAGKRPTGRDKFNVMLVIDNWRQMRLYYYHPDQAGGYGDYAGCYRPFCRPVLSPGKWYCLELLLKTNTPGQKDGQLKAWLDGRLVIKEEGLRFRDIGTVKIRRFTIANYFGGGLKSDTSPKDQRIYIDNYVVSKERIGCMDVGDLGRGELQDPLHHRLAVFIHFLKAGILCTL